jgi:GT2 family glycosyltransferase
MTALIRLCGVLTSYNRREKTLSALRSFFAQGQGMELSAVLMDDGSEDGTTTAVQAEFPQVIVLKGDGSLYWNRGMAVAYKVAFSLGADYYLWLNDDTKLYPNALSSLLMDDQSICNPTGSIIIGSTQDPDTGALTYGGVRAISKWHMGKFMHVEPSSELQSCDAMNGNIVLISDSATRSIGEMDWRFSHAIGDFDYGLRAVCAGVSLVLGRGVHGTCARNPAGSAWYECQTMRGRLQRVNTPKGLPMKEWAYFLRRHGGLTWPLAWLATYRRIITG